MKDESQIEKLTLQTKKVIEKYKEEFPDVIMDKDYLPLKITEEWGECLQTYLMLTKRGRQKGKSKTEIKKMFTEECADVFGYILLFANQENIDLAEALNKKWFTHLEK